jgi:hypothetical protein
MQLSNAPAQIVKAWATAGSKTNPIPVPSQIGITPGAASWTDGFPPLCDTDASAGGIPPTMPDMNGGLYQMSAVDLWMCAGGGFPYSSAFSAAIGGYPKGARVQMASGAGYWMSTADNNATDPDTSGAGWIVAFPAPPAPAAVVSSAYQSIAQTITSTIKVTIDTVEFDPASMWDSTNKRFVATIAGYYRVSGVISTNLSAPGGDENVAVYVNGAMVKIGQGNSSQFTGSAELMYLNFDVVIHLSVSDYVEVYLEVSGSTITQTGAASTYAQIQLLR